MEKYTGYVMLEAGKVNLTGVCRPDALPQGALLIPEANVSAVQHGDDWDNYTADGLPKPYRQLIKEGKLRLVDVEDARLDARDRLKKQAMLGLGTQATEAEIQAEMLNLRGNELLCRMAYFADGRRRESWARVLERPVVTDLQMREYQLKYERAKYDSYPDSPNFPGFSAEWENPLIIRRHEAAQKRILAFSDLVELERRILYAIVDDGLARGSLERLDEAEAALGEAVARPLAIAELGPWAAKYNMQKFLGKREEV